MWEKWYHLMAVVMLLFLAACVSTAQPVAQQARKDDRHEYLIYRIDDHRYITILSDLPCGDRSMDGTIYYHDAREGVRTRVLYTGPTRNGFYRGYYVVHSSPKYIAIPSFYFSEVSGMYLLINYSHDGGRTFQSFLGGGDGENTVIIQDNKTLYLTRRNPEDPNEYRNEGAAFFDLSRDMDPEIAHDSYGEIFRKYGDSVPRRQIPFDLRPPSGATRWACPTTPIN